jgi:hypothetical protein
MRRTDWYVPFLPLLVLAAIYSAATGEWWAFGSLAAVPVLGSLTDPIDRYYGEATAPVERLALALEHLLAVVLVVLLVLRAPGIFGRSAVLLFVWIAAVVGLGAYFVRAALAWWRFRRDGAPG